MSYLFVSGTTNVNEWPTKNIICYELTPFCVLSNSHGDDKYDWLLCNEVPFKKMSHCMIRTMSWTDSILRPIQHNFLHIRTMIGKCDWFCEMKSRSGSEIIARASRSRERYFRVQETAYNQTELVCETHETGTIFTNVHILMDRILNLINFLPQVHNSLRNSDAITSSCQINK